MSSEPNPFNPGSPAPGSGTPPLLTPLARPPKPPRKRWLLKTIGLLVLAWVGYTAFKPTPPPPSPPPVAPQGPPRWAQPSPNRRVIPDQPPGFSPNRPRPVVSNAPKPAKPAKVTGPRAAAPLFAQAGGVFTDDATVELRAKAPGAKIRYTLDGSEPSETSLAYAGPLSIAGTTLVKAKAFEPGLAPSPTVSQTYTMIDRTLTGFNSNLPLVIVNTFGQSVGKEESVPASLRVIDPGKQRSSLTATGGFDGRCEIKLRGYSSLRFPKHSYTVKTRDDEGEALPVEILGLPKDSDWVLYAPYSDKTLMRDVLAYELSNKIGRYAARTRYVEVFLSRSGTKLGKRDYLGVYVFEEKIKRSKDRVNIQKLTPEDKAEPNITGGYIFKRDHMTGPMDGRFGFVNNVMPNEESGFVTTRGVNFFYVDPKETEITEPQKAYLTRYMSQLERAIYGPNFRSPTEGFAKYLDVDSFIDQFWIVELSKNVDGFRYSCYLSKDRGGKVRLEPIWDWNLSFGNANYHEGWMTEGWYFRLLRENEISWFRRLSQDRDFMQRTIDRWSELRKKAFSPDAILSRIDELAGLLSEAQARNFQRWPILGQSVNPNYFVGESYEEEINWMKNWIQERIAWIDSQFLPSPTISKDAAPQLKAPAGEIFFTLDGSDPRAPGGEVSTNAQQYTEPVAMKPGTQLWARTRAGANWSGPAKVKR